MTERTEKLVVLFLAMGFLLFLIFCSCKNENLIDPLDILDSHNPETWRQVRDCEGLTASSQARLVPPPVEGTVDICTGPNPTSGSICFQYVLPSEMNVSLAIYSEKGEKVTTIVRERQTANTYVYVWDLADDNGIQVANGTYRAYFMAGDYVTHGDIVVQR
ncbi:MAG: hypothetical protein NTX17_06510 [Candidatus Eisenbacteria bacterium]|nr:hypothetical protein [Candidatus Eisenbacteria bacterium]